MRSQTVFEAHQVIPGRFALCAVGAKAVRVLHPRNERMGQTIDRVLNVIAGKPDLPSDAKELSPLGHTLHRK